MSNQPNAGQLVLDQLRASLDGSRYSLTAVYAAVIVAFGGAVAIILGILAGWHTLKEVYAPKPLLAARMATFSAQTSEDKCEDGALPVGYYPTTPCLKTCLKTAWSADEQQISNEHGLDAAVYIRALKMMRNIFILLTLLLFCTAAPINIAFNLQAKYVDNLTKKDALLLLTPTLLSSKQLIPHVVLGWVTNTVVLAILWRNYDRVLAMRQQLFNSIAFQKRLSSRTVLLTDLPRSLRTNEGAARVLNHANPHHCAPESISVGHKNPSRLHELVEQHRNKVIQLEREMLKSPHSTRCSEINSKCNALARAVESHRSMLSVNAPVTASSNTIKSSSSTAAVLAAVSPSGYGFAAYGSFRDALSVTKRGRIRCLDGGVHVQLAPPPSHILWQNIGLTAATRGTKQLVVNMLYGVLLILWIFPSAFIGCFLANLNRLGAVWPAFGGAMAQHPVAFAILQGVLAPILTTSVFAALPMIFRRFSRLQGKVTRIEREHEVLRKLYAFFFLDNYFLFTIMGVIWDIVAQVLQQTQAAKAMGEPLTFDEVWHSLRVAQRIATAIVNLSSFWVLYLLRGIFALFGGAAQPVTLLSRLGQNMNFLRKPTPRERAERSMPQPFQYAVSFLSILFNSTIALGFTSIQPLVLPVTMILFTLAVPLKKYEIIHMQITKHESNGMYWPLVSDITLFALAIGNLVLLCVVWVQAGWQIAAGVCPLAFTVIIFKIITIFKFERHFYYPDTNDYKHADDPQLVSDQQPFNYQSNLSSKQLSGAYKAGNEDYDYEDDDEEEKLRLCEYYEDPACHAPLEKPLLTFRDALCYFASINLPISNQSPVNKSTANRMDTKMPSELPTNFPNNSTGSLENPFETGYDMHPPSVGIVSYGTQSPYTPIEPYPVYHTDFDSYYQPPELNQYGQDPDDSSLLHSQHRMN